MLKTPKSQKAQKLLSQKARNQVLNLLHRQQPVHNRRPVRKTKRIYHQINRHQDNQMHENKQTNKQTEYEHKTNK